MTTDELKKEAREKMCLETGQCVYNSTEDAKKAIIGKSESSTTSQTSGTKTISIQETKKRKQYVEGIDNNLLAIGGVVVFIIIILLLGILIELNRIAKKN